MLDRLDTIIAAFQQENGTFRLRSLSSPAFRSAMRPTRSQGASAGKVGIVSRRIFEQRGQDLGSVAITKAG
jgi:hypothetical protein